MYVWDTLTAAVDVFICDFRIQEFEVIDQACQTQTTSRAAKALKTACRAAKALKSTLYGP